jgi:hypothetical protein
MRVVRHCISVYKLRTLLDTALKKPKPKNFKTYIGRQPPSSGWYSFQSLSALIVLAIVFARVRIQVNEGGNYSKSEDITRDVIRTPTVGSKLYE